MIPKAPAIILITADQLRKDALSCYGNKAISTPHVDSLAEGGLQLDRAYTVSPWCLPSRCSILTGLFPHNSGAYSNFRENELSAATPTLYSELKKGGYHIGHFGKCHYVPVKYSALKGEGPITDESVRARYVALGIDDLCLQDDKGVSPFFYDDYSRQLDKTTLEAYRGECRNPKNAGVFDFPGDAKWHADFYVGEKAAGYIASYAQEKPLFLWASFSGPHHPFDGPPEYFQRVNMDQVGEGVFREGEWDDSSRLHFSSYHGPSTIDGGVCKNHSPEYWKNLRRNYYANTALIDDGVGKILKAVRERFGEEALIIFTADHGEMLGNHRLWGKDNCGYEDVLNVPFLMRYPKSISGAPRGERSAAATMLTDILPTCVEVAGLEPLQGDGLPIGKNIKNGGHPFIFAEGENFITVSDGLFKFVQAQSRKTNAQYRELFDLSNDPLEYENVITRPEYAPHLARLQEAIVNLFLKKLLP